MNRTEHLLTCLSEECAEVQQAVSKALRFGLSDGRPGFNSTNAQDIGRELVEVMAVMELLVDSCALKLPADRLYLIEQKKQRVRKWMEFAKQQGTLTTED